MPPARPTRPTRLSGARGFTLMELLLTVVVIGMLAAIMVPRIGGFLQRAGSRQAAGVVATDLESAVSLAARIRVPVRIACDCPNGILLFTNRNTGAVLRRRVLGGQSGGFHVQSLALSGTVDVYPTGTTSGPLTVTLGTLAGTRQIAISSAGFVRVIP